MRRIVAANRVVLPDGGILCPGVVELDGCRVVRTDKLFEEQPFTEWLGGIIVVRDESCGVVRAYKDGRMLEAS